MISTVKQNSSMIVTIRNKKKDQMFIIEARLAAVLI